MVGTRGGALLAALLGTGCLGDAVEAMTSAASDAPAATSGTTETSSAGSTTTSVDGNTDATGSDDTGNTLATTTHGESTETTEVTPPDPCAVHDNEACAATPGCRPITCRPYQMSTDPVATDPWCIGDHTFIGCITVDPGCEPMRTVACADADEGVYTCPSDCLPHGYAPCEPPTPNVPQPC